MKRNVIKIITIFALLTITLNIFGTKVYADPSSSQGFAGYDDETADKITNEELKNQEVQENNDYTEEKSNNNFLSELSVKGYTLSPEFNKQTIDYTIENCNEDTLEITAVAEDTRATVTGAGTVSINPDGDDIKIDVAAETGTVRTYHIRINQETANSVNTIETRASTNKETSNKNIVIGVIIGILLIIVIVIFLKK